MFFVTCTLVKYTYEIFKEVILGRYKIYFIDEGKCKMTKRGKLNLVIVLLTLYFMKHKVFTFF